MKYKKLGLQHGLAPLFFAATLAACATQPPAGPFYADLGGQAGITALVETFATHLYSDARTVSYFEDVDPKETRLRLQAQFCDLSGGPCKTINPDMKKTHSGMDITQKSFDAVVLLLTQSMQEHGISPASQQRLLEKVQLMQQDIVNTPG